VKALVKLASEERFAKTTVPLLFAQLRTAPVNQLPMYAELVGVVMRGRDVAACKGILEERLVDVPQPAKRKRIERVLKNLAKAQA
jgi:hypothetical protein